MKVGVLVELTKSEMEIMDVLWDAGAPLSRSDLVGDHPDKSWKDASVHILLNGLLKKGAIKEVGFVKRSKTFGRTFSPALTREQYFATTIFCHRRKPQIVPLIKELLSRQDITDEERHQIKSLIADC